MKFAVLFSLSLLTVFSSLGFAHNFSCDQKTMSHPTWGETLYSELQFSVGRVTSYSLWGSVDIDTVEVLSKSYRQDQNAEVYQVQATHYARQIKDLVLEFVLDAGTCEFLAGQVLEGTIRHPNGRVQNLAGKILEEYRGTGH